MDITVPADTPGKGPFEPGLPVPVGQQDAPGMTLELSAAGLDVPQVGEAP